MGGNNTGVLGKHVLHLHCTCALEKNLTSLACGHLHMELFLALTFLVPFPTTLVAL